MFENYLNSANTLINFHVPLKKTQQKTEKVSTKPWITKGIQNSVGKKNRLDCNKKFCI